MLSAIPWIGTDFTQFVFILCLVPFHVFFSSEFIPTVGNVNSRSIRPRNSMDKSKYQNVSYDFISMFAGFVDGDGYIKLTRATDGYISFELVISLDVRDAELLRYFYSVLQVGRINYYNTTVKYIIGRIDLQEIVFPLLIHHGIYFITHTHRQQYALALHVLTNNIVWYADVPTNLNSNIYPLPTTPAGYLSIPGIGLLVLLWLKDHSTLRLLMSFIFLSDNVNILHFLKLSEFYLIQLELLTYLLLDIQSLMFLPLRI